ncbi:MAG: hypothetical protein KGL19_04900 [Bacteroidota bacterium]|nr:hypothetical protein [Bacteroidota bacterium]
MFKKLIKALFLLIGIVWSTTNIAQTITHPINYTSSGLDPNFPCNIFNVSSFRVIGGYTHQPCAGGVTFDGTNLVLQTKYAFSPTSSNLGTAYAIAFPFKAGYIYSLSVVAKGTDGSGGTNFPQLQFSLFNTNPAPAPTNCGDVGQDSWGGLQQGLVGGFSVSASSQTYTVPNFTIPLAGTPPAFLIVLASGGSTSSNAALISSITINETNSAQFNITASPTSEICGSTTPVTFTVSNVNNTSGVTDYTFNLGTNNGWQYNGAAARSTIDAGTSNSIQLTPTCGSPLNSVSATVTVNGTSVNTYNPASASVAITQPNMSIISASGNYSVCNTDSYSITNLPCNAAVTWSVSPQGIVTPSSTTGPTTSLTNAGISGTVTLTANVTSCGTVNTPITQSIHIGNYTSSDYNLVNNTTNSNFYCVGKSISFSVTGAAASNYVWTIPPGWQTLYGGNGNNYDVILPTTTPTGTVSVNFTEPCGTTVTENTFLAYSNNVCVNNDPRYGYSPNPAPTNLNVYVNSAYLTNTFFTQIQLVQINTGSTLFSQYYGAYTQNATIYMGSFPSGSYTLRVFDGSVWATYIVMH